MRCWSTARSFESNEASPCKTLRGTLFIYYMQGRVAMKSDAIINGKTITLANSARKAGEAFHKKRYAFAWVGGKLVYNDNEQDDRDHQHWLLEEYGITPEMFEAVPRGYMMGGRIQFLLGSAFGEVNMDTIKAEDITALVRKHTERYGLDKVEVYNGVIIGKIGEIWKPKTHIGTCGFGTTQKGDVKHE